MLDRCTVRLRAGDVLRILTPGGGGWGFLGAATAQGFDVIFTVEPTGTNESPLGPPVKDADETEQTVPGSIPLLQ